MLYKAWWFQITLHKTFPWNACSKQVKHLRAEALYKNNNWRILYSCYFRNKTPCHAISIIHDPYQRYHKWLIRNTTKIMRHSSWHTIVTILYSAEKKRRLINGLMQFYYPTSKMRWYDIFMSSETTSNVKISMGDDFIIKNVVAIVEIISKRIQRKWIKQGIR